MSDYSSEKIVEIIARSGGYFTYEILRDIIQTDTLHKYLIRNKKYVITQKKYKKDGSYILRLPYKDVDPYWKIRRGESYHQMMRSFTFLEYFKETKAYILKYSEINTTLFSTEFLDALKWHPTKKRAQHISCIIENGEWIPVIIIHDHYTNEKNINTIISNYITAPCQIHILGMPDKSYDNLVKNAIFNAEGILFKQEVKDKEQLSFMPDLIVKRALAKIRVFKYPALRKYYGLPEYEHERQIAESISESLNGISR